MSIRRFMLILLVGVAPIACSSPQAETAPPRGEHMLWRIDGEHNRIWLFGSVHLLREQDYPLAPAIMDAYREASVLVMELDFDDLDIGAMQKDLLEQSRLADGETLSGFIGNDAYEQARELAAGLGLNIDMFAYFEPWFAALTIATLELTKRGFTAEHGIEAHFAALAERDGKPVTGLETADYQLGLFDNMSRTMQRDLLIQTLHDVQAIDTEFGQIIGAWRSGDADRLATLLLDSFAEFPQLYEALIVKRNSAWTKEIVRRIDDGTDYMVIVGALHLAGDDSLIRMLERRGIRAHQL